MSIYNSKRYMDDLDYTIERNPWLDELDGSKFLITGASGLICSSIIDLLLRFSETKKGKIEIYAAGRNEKKTMERFSKYVDEESFHFVKYDATRSNTFGFRTDYIIHGASNAYPGIYMKHPVETMLDNFNALYELLEYARKVNSKKIVFISSSEIYGKNNLKCSYHEEDYGFIDIMNPRSCYSNGKRAGETLCACYYQEYNVNALSVRPGHVYGPTASRSDSRVSSSFVFDASDGKDIVMKSDGRQIRSYCYMLDVATSILLAALRGNAGEAYNISNPDSIISIKEMADLITNYSGVNLKFSIPNTKEKDLFNPMDISSLDSGKIQLLGWKGLFDAITGFGHTIQIIKEAGI